MPAGPEARGGTVTGETTVFSHFGLMALVAIAPFAIIAGTSFAKIAVVLGLVRSALGAPGVPPASVITALAAVLSLGIMAPVVSEMADAAELAAKAGGPGDKTGDALGIGEARAIYAAVSPPMLDFLAANAPDAEVDFFRDLAADGGAVDRRSVRVLLPAFALSEIVEAFLIGFLLLVPFLVVDLIVANSLLALGLPSLPPTAVSLPLKLLLFLAVDGWHVLVSGLAISYA
jgi:type III secretion protein R